MNTPGIYGQCRQQLINERQGKAPQYESTIVNLFDWRLIILNVIK
jgi:hypothetical protein